MTCSRFFLSLAPDEGRSGESCSSRRRLSLQPWLLGQGRIRIRPYQMQDFASLRTQGLRTTCDGDSF